MVSAQNSNQLLARFDKKSLPGHGARKAIQDKPLSASGRAMRSSINPTTS